jgi:hypothetical protein
MRRRGDGRTWPVNEENRRRLEAISRQIRLDEEPPSSSETESGSSATDDDGEAEALN